MARKCVEYITCDRCGKEFIELPLEQASMLKPTYVYMKMFVRARKKERILSREKIPYDICKECSESLVDWFVKGNRR